ncbi:hypothetical protein [Herpetosiphon giganteus]|uniref:hypothetical protein n=1 Tax=Herpetosiphon giganteus TaxID=2029754 RepID=UPI00195B951D|nr:hypothetical protein [Herpetosiphon giganteus]MBM7843854.1 O-antigen/teichoic acid export membrane protein [Herpetosiphon giganteus]
MKQCKRGLKLIGYGVLSVLIGFCYLVPTSEYRSAQGIAVYDPDTVLVIQWLVAGLLIPVGLLLVRAIRQRQQRFGWLESGVLLASLILLIWRWLALNAYQYPFPETLR